MRDKIVDYVRREIVGPDPVPPHIQENGEEILLSDPPRLRYSAGILFPQSSTFEKTECLGDDEKELIDTTSKEDEDYDVPDSVLEEKTEPSSTDTDQGEDPTNLANSFLPSAMGFSCYLAHEVDGLAVKVHAGIYYKNDHYTFKGVNGVEKTRKAYFRNKIETEIRINGKDLPTINNRSVDIDVLQNNQRTGLVLNVRNRTSKREGIHLCQFFTFTLLNSKQSSGIIRNEDCFFQVEFTASIFGNKGAFQPYLGESTSFYDEESRSKFLLYRKHKTFAIGHGCSPQWEIDNSGTVSSIHARNLPLHEVKPTVPSLVTDIDLNMYQMSDKGDFRYCIKNLNNLCKKYTAWINEQRMRAKNEFDSSDEHSMIMLETAFTHIKKCQQCCSRMEDGLRLLDEEPDAAKAFQLMNRAMLTQQLRYSLRLRKWEESDELGWQLESKNLKMPDISDPQTWPDWDDNRGTRLGKWRPFQIAFILMNLRSMVDSRSEGRKIVDLIWFPTGGGKTEAYLGLTAFTIFYKRLRNKHDSGTTVLMRYTLRLLTTQQFQRAASLICACEDIRYSMAEELGDDMITIGLWVGRESTPNTRQQANETFLELQRGDTPQRSFIVLKCPWCGVQMGAVTIRGQIRLQGYERTRNPRNVVIKCPNPLCEFYQDRLPVEVIDDNIYDNPPTLLIGTVDKFATLPWRPQAKSLFGFRQSHRITPPELIIQDELHLISGPLGSVVGHYEMLINELCSSNGIRPKIVASTATISRASEQCHNLYNCDSQNVYLFPPQCLNAGESFFAREDTDVPGRLYCGVFATGSPSHATTQIRILASLIQGVKSIEGVAESEKDPYWTIVSYYNSLRELGHAATMIQADIREYLFAMWLRKGFYLRKEQGIDQRRFINKWIELTSRIPSYRIPEYLQELEVKYDGSPSNTPVDICLATNMISVGVDIGRLGLMTVTGQPKTTSEYIQATSRVGRLKDAPGLVFTIYNTSRPRDRSHFEHFQSYHSSIYSQVEPTSVTPFACPVRERCLHAVLTALIRFYGNESNLLQPQPIPSNELFTSIAERIKEWTSAVAPGELEHTLRLLEEKIDEWKRFMPSHYGNFSYNDSPPPLMYPSGRKPLDSWRHRSWATPSSMRSVDSTCNASLIRNYPRPDCEEGKEDASQ